MKKLRTIDLYLIPLLFVGIATVILRSIALLTSFNTVTMHFDNKIAITISAVMVLLAIIGFATYLFLGEKERELIARTDNARNYIPAGILSIALLFMGARNFGMAFDVRYTDVISVLSFICGVLAFLSAASFFLSVFIEKNGSSAAASIIATETGISCYTLDMAMSADSYFSAMYHNINTIREALQ